MAWELDGRIGTVRINGITRHGVAWMRENERGQLAFHALPLRFTFEPAAKLPPKAERHIVSQDDFRPAS